MAHRSVKMSQLGSVAAEEIRKRLPSAGLGALIVAQAKRRMRAGGDSQHRYLDLWDPPFPARRRAGEQPLLDTARGLQSLNSKVESTARGVKVMLRGLLYLVYHQHGFKTKGPNFIPLTNKAVVTHRKGANPRDEGLVSVQEWEAAGKPANQPPDYFMAWKGVKVPQRMIHNMPPEDRAEVRFAISDAIGGRAVA